MSREYDTSNGVNLVAQPSVSLRSFKHLFEREEERNRRLSFDRIVGIHRYKCDELYVFY